MTKQSEAQCECGHPPPPFAFVEYFQPMLSETSQNEQIARFGFWVCEKCLDMWDEDEKGKGTAYNVYRYPCHKMIEAPDKVRFYPG